MDLRPRRSPFLDFVDLPRLFRARMVERMRAAFAGAPNVSPAAPPFRECDWPARWWSAGVAFSGPGQAPALKRSWAIILPARQLRPAYLDKLWSDERGKGGGGRLLSALVRAAGTMHWRTSGSLEWYLRWGQRTGCRLRVWRNGRYDYVRAGPAARSWEAEDAGRGWLTMPSAWER